MKIPMFGRRLVPVVAALLLAAPAVSAQQRLLTIDDIYDPSTRVNFSGNAPSDLSWIDSARYAQLGTGGTWLSVDAVSGSERPLFDAAKMEAALSRLGVNANDARRMARSRTLTFNHKYSAALLTIDSDLYVYHFDSDKGFRLTTAAGTEELPSFSPNGSTVAFVRNNDLYAVDTEGRGETRLTTDGAAKILNGILDWVYDEEIYGRGDKPAYWWSPDSSRIALLRLDDTPVPSYVTVDDIPYEQNVEHWDWPKAGDPNPIATLGVVRTSGGPVAWVNTDKYPSADRLIVGVDWMPDAQTVVYEVQNRIQ